MLTYAEAGALSGPPTTSVDKLEIMQRLLLGAAGGGARDRVVYVGDSVTDLLALLAADVGAYTEKWNFIIFGMLMYAVDADAGVVVYADVCCTWRHCGVC